VKKNTGTGPTAYIKINKGLCTNKRRKEKQKLEHDNQYNLQKELCQALQPSLHLWN
jgi:hypothetical protein